MSFMHSFTKELIKNKNKKKQEYTFFNFYLTFFLMSNSTEKIKLYKMK